MTSRLKRKLGDLGVDVSSQKVNENFCLIGTPLPPLEKSKDTGEFVPLWKQEVRDEKGRRRLHGAFTGGFSAGYFNTVGSKEGWTPSTFVSSRSERAKQKVARPEDFMDEEDLAEIKEGQKLVDVNEEMDFGTKGERQRNETEKDSLVQALEATLLPPARDSIGARILRKMGWRLGQGIGPRVTWEKRKEQDILYSDESSARDNLQEEEDEEAKKHLYPPRDTKVPVFSRKDNSFGLGYTPGLGLTDLVSGTNQQSTSSNGPNLSTGFGLGALNDAEEDDLDVYDRGYNIGSSRLAYEGAVDDEERVLLGSNKHKPSNRDRNLPKKLSSVQVFHDGRPVLQGFVLAAKPVKDDRWYPLPEVPKDWTPNPRRVWEQNKENLTEISPVNTELKSFTKGSSSGWRNDITAEQRGAMLGETPLPAAPRSVFDYLAPKDRERLKNMATGLTGSTDAAPGPLPDSEHVPLSVPRIDPHIAKSALHGFQPFVSDPVKQSRYTEFLKAQATSEEDLPFGPFPGQSRIEFNKELEDYGKAAQIFKPVSGSMASRFTSASVIDFKSHSEEGLYTPSSSKYTSAESESEQKAEKEESPKEHAARVGMFGPLTRETKLWIPAKLLCKRFGVKDPNPEPMDDTLGDPLHSTSASTRKPEEELNSSETTAIGQVRIGENASDREVKRPPLANIGLGDDETQGQDVLTYERPARDIFKAIFASDDEDSDDDDDANKDEDEEPTLSVGETAPGKEPIIVTAEKKPAEVDLSSFKPTFVPRADRAKHKEDGGMKDKSTTKKEKKRKHGKVVLVSFDVEEDGEGDIANKEKESSKRQKKRKEHAVVDDESMWVEKAPPEGVVELKNTLLDTAISSEDGESKDIVGPSRGRKRAVDFL